MSYMVIQVPRQKPLTSGEKGRLAWSLLVDVTGATWWSMVKSKPGRRVNSPFRTRRARDTPQKIRGMPAGNFCTAQHLAPVCSSQASLLIAIHDLPDTLPIYPYS